MRKAYRYLRKSKKNCDFKGIRELNSVQSKARMHIEVDQSGKIEQLNKDSYIAFSDGEQYCVKLPKKIKQEISLTYKSRTKQLVQKLFSICLFCCLKNHIRNKELVMIDIEYPGWEGFIKRELINLIRNQDADFDKNIIKFGVITKKSNAHKLALRTYRNIIKPNKILNKEDIIRLLK